MDDRLQVYRRAFEALEVLPEDKWDRPWPEPLSSISSGTRLTQAEALIFELVFDELRYRSDTAKREASPFLSTPILRPNTLSPPPQDRRPDLRDQLEEARRAKVAADLDIQRATEGIEAMPGSKELLPGFIVLAFFSVTGVVVPLVMIATQESLVLSSTRKVVCLAGFGIGLLALGVYLFRQLRSLDGTP